MLTLLFLALLQEPPRLSADDFAKLHKDLAPPKDERWRAIPWQLTMLGARETAAKEKKPIFLWSMNGHPGGCV